MSSGSSKWRWGGWIVLAVLNCALVIPWLSSLVPQPRDFNAFYMAATLYRDNPGRTLYDLNLQLRMEQRMFHIDDAHSSKYFLPFNHLPYELVFWLPLTSLPFHLAFWVWRLWSVGLLAVASWLLVKTLGLRRPAATVLLISLAFFPIPSSLMTGQDTAVTMLLFVVCLWFLKKGKALYAGMVLGMCLFKVQLVIPVAGVLLLCGAWRVAVGFASSGIVVTAVSVAMVGYDGMKDLLRLWLTGENGGMFCIRPALMPNIRGLITTVSAWPPREVFIAATATSFIALLVATKQGRGAQSHERLFAICMCFVALVSFHTNVYHLSILIFPILMLLDRAPSYSLRLRWMVMPPIVLLFFTPLYVIAAATIKIGLLAIVVGWLWLAVSYGTDAAETEACEALASAPELVAVR